MNITSKTQFNVKKKTGFYYLYLNFVANLFFVYCMIIAIALIVFSLITIKCEVIGASMQPTYNKDLKAGNDVVYVNSLDKDYGFGDIVVIDVGKDDPIIKRIIGLPGDVIDVIFDENIGYKLEINGKLIEEDYLNIDYKLSYVHQNGLSITHSNFHEKMKVSYPDLFKTGKLVVPENELFVLGDNRHDSQDSWYYGTFSYDSVLGLVELEKYHNESEFWFYWDYVVQGKFIQTIINCF